MLRIVLLIVFTICSGLLVTAQKNEISENEFLAKETFGDDAIDKSSRRLIRTLEYFEDRSKPGRVAERYTEEVLKPDKWRKIEEKDYAGKKTREERLWDGSALYVRQNDGEWTRYSGGATSGARIESGRVTKTYRYLGKSELNGQQVERYQVQSVRIANKFSATDMVVVTYVRDSQYWFNIGGRLIKKVEETMLEGRPEMSRETTTVEYDPKMTIEAPIK